jgi:putative endonuclease
MYYVYVLRINKSGRYYIGQTQNLSKRLEKHARGETKSIKNREEFEVIYIEKHPSRADAMKREKEIKSYKSGEAFKRLVSGFAEQKKTNAELAEVPPLAE